MELTETVSSINNQLIDLFGIDTLTGAPIWRVAWSEDQLEKRYGTYDDYTSSGIYLRTVTEVREVPKYRQWIKEKYVVERLTLIPDVSKEDLPTEKLSYEPMYVFEDVRGRYLPPKLEAAKFVIDSIYAAMGKSSLAKYKDPDNCTEAEMENTRDRIAQLQEELFGDETTIGDALAHKEGIIVPHTYKGDS